MTAFVLSPLKTVLASAPHEWLEATGGDCVLLTGKPNRSAQAELVRGYGDAFREIHHFPDYAENDEVSWVADSLLSAGDLVIPLSEQDVLRAASLRERHGLQGMRVDDATLFRDKIAMKTRARAAGIPVAGFRRVSDPLMLKNALGSLGLPAVIKPIAGRGSSQTAVVASEDDVRKLLRSGIFSGTDRVPDMMVESFVRGRLHHVDGFLAGGDLKHISAGAYQGTHLEFLGGAHMGSLLLPAADRLAQRLVEFTRRVLAALGIGADAHFHLEAFVAEDGTIYLNEVGARLPGGLLVEEIQVGYEIDLKLAALKAWILGECWPGESRQLRPSGDLIISPREGTLVAVPETCPFSWVHTYRHAEAGSVHTAMTHTNAEVAGFAFEAGSQAELRRNMDVLVEWFHSSSEWRS